MAAIRAKRTNQRIFAVHSLFDIVILKIKSRVQPESSVRTDRATAFGGWK